MIRTLFAVAALAASLGLAPAQQVPTAPAPRPAEPKLYFPTAVGDQWVDESNQGTVTTGTVIAVEQQKGRKLVTFREVRQQDGAEVVVVYKYAVAADGVYFLGGPLRRPTDPLDDFREKRMLRLPHNADHSYEESIFFGEREITAKFTAKRETVKVPAGTFAAIRVDQVCKDPFGNDDSVTYWYAPGVGLVKWKRFDLVFQMKSFTPAKK